ncbi:MAG TPA: hypothetical protein VNP04_29300 [Alphaproteobacteria bacterium]|nr:hypothetical protein [Alphaproteobacteria bacterium]
MAITVSGVVTAQPYCSLPESIYYYVEDEYGEVSPSGQAEVNSGNGSFSFQVSLEASRRGSDLDGRWYAIELDTVDGGQADIYVTVPHDQRKK